MFLFCTNNFEKIFVATKLYFIKVTSGQGQTFDFSAVFYFHIFQKNTVGEHSSPEQCGLKEGLSLTTRVRDVLTMVLDGVRFLKCLGRGRVSERPSSLTIRGICCSGCL